MDRLLTEQLFHDRQAADRAPAFQDEHRLRFEDDAYLDHETWIRPAFDQLGDVRGLDVLDYGCGHAMAAIVLARQGARVTALDLSGGYLAEARRRARVNRVTIQAVQADAERLPFADASFDRIWGNAILHHLDMARAAREIHRVLRPGGLAVLCEPWGGNALLRWARRRLPYPGKQRTPDEEPLREGDLAPLREWFPALQVDGCQLLAMAGRLLGPGRLSRQMARWDAALLRAAPPLWRWCRYVVLVLRRP